jgi:cytochrome P450
MSSNLGTPEHIPASLIRDFNLFNDPLFADDLHDGIAGLAAEQRDLFWTPAAGGAWVVVGRDAAFEASTDYDLFSNSASFRYGDALETLMVPIGLDPPAHTPYRKILSDIFSPKAVAAYEPIVRQQAVELIDAVLDQGGCDFATAVAEPLPVIFFMKLFGLPTDRVHEFRRWVIDGFSEPDPVVRQKIWNKILAVTGALIDARRIKREDDIISRLIDTEIDGRPLTFDELQSFSLMLFGAGLDTVTNAMSMLMRHIASDPDLQEQMRSNEKSIPLTIEELMRRYSGNTVPRYVTRDAEFRGAPLRRGDFVLVHFPAANLDPRGNPDPLTVDVERRAPHLGFGAGVHRCVGAQLARIEMKAMFSEWLRRVPPFRLDPDRHWKYHTGFVFTVDSLPLVWER